MIKINKEMLHERDKKILYLGYSPAHGIPRQGKKGQQYSIKTNVDRRVTRAGSVSIIVESLDRLVNDLTLMYCCFDGGSNLYYRCLYCIQKNIPSSTN